MPLTRISLRRGKGAAFIKTVVDQLYAALTESFDVPKNDLFAIVSQHDEDELIFDRTFLGVERDDDFIVFQITARSTRTTETKQAFYKTLVEKLAADPGIEPRNVMVNLVGVGKDDWSFGNGIAQYVEP